MKWYFASRTKHREAVRAVTELLRGNGHEVVSQWVNFSDPQPYEQNVDECGMLAREVARSVQSADVFVLVSDVAGTDMFVELGLALAANHAKGSPKVYIIGEHGRRSLMQLHPEIVHKKTLNEVFAAENVRVMTDHF